MSVESFEAIDIGAAAVAPSVPVEWWYLNLLVDAPGTPLHGGGVIGTLARMGGVTEEVRAMVISPTGEVADFGTSSLPFNSFEASTTELDVSYEGNYIRGGHPHYEMHLQGVTEDGTPCSLALTYAADMAPEQNGYLDRQIKHYVVYRMRGSGTITIGEETHEVSGSGYFEHLLGTFGWQEAVLGVGRGEDMPAFLNGWNWYWTPELGADRVGLQVAGFMVDEADVPYLAVTTDGGRVTHFGTGRTRVLEEREYAGYRYAHKLQLTDSNSEGEIDVTITRDHLVAQRTTRPGPAGSHFAFITGLAAFEGRATIDGVSYDLSGSGFGSVFRLVEGTLFGRIRSLPPVVRRPLGHVVSALGSLTSR